MEDFVVRYENPLKCMPPNHTSTPHFVCSVGRGSNALSYCSSCSPRGHLTLTIFHKDRRKMTVEYLSSDVDTVLWELSAGLEASRLQHRLQVLEAFVDLVGARVPSEAEAISKPQTRHLVRMLLGALCNPQYLERSWIKGLYNIIGQSTKSERCPMFTVICGANLAGMVPSAANRQAQLTILRISRLLLEVVTPDDATGNWPEWARKVVSTQAGILERVGSVGDERLLMASYRILHQGLRSCPHLLELYLDTLTPEDVSYHSSVALAGVTAHATNLPHYEGAIKHRMLAIYVRDTLMRKGGCDEHYKLASFSIIMRSLTSADFSEVLLPVLEKLLKKNPDSILAAVTLLVGNLNIDLSAHIGIFLPPLLRQLRSVKEQVRLLAVKLIRSLADRCGDTEVLEYLVSELSDLLAGRSGVMAQWYQRHCVFLAFEEVRKGVVSTPMSSSCAVKLRARALDGLMPAVEKESHDDTRAIGLGCVTRWTLKLSSIPPQLEKFLKNGLGSTTRSVAITSTAALCQLSEWDDFRVQLTSLLPELLSRLDIGAKKPTVFHPDAIFSAKAVLELAANDKVLFNMVGQAFPWHAFVREDSFIFPVGVLGPQDLSPSVGEAAGPLLPHVCEVICKVVALAAKHIVAASTEGSREGTQQPLSDASASALMRCALHPLKVLRRTALMASMDVCGMTTEVQATLLKALGKVVRSTASTETARLSVKYLPSAKDDGKSVLSCPPPNRFAAALCGILSRATPGSILADALILAHHPMVCHSAKGAVSLWSGIQVKAFGGVQGMDRLLQDEACATDVATCIVNTVQSELDHDRLSAQWALASVGSPEFGELGSNIVADRIFPALLAVLTDKDLRGLAPKEVDIFFTPTNTAYAAPLSLNQPIAAASKNATRRGKDAVEAEWEERMRAELGSKGKKGQTSPESAKSEAMTRLLAEEDAVRKRVRCIRHRAKASLKGLQSGFQSCPKLGVVCVSSALSVLMPLLGWKLLDSEAQACVKAVAWAASTELGDRSSLVASALRAVGLHSGTSGRCSAVKECLEVVAEACASELPLEQHTLALIFPVVREVLINPASAAHCTSALKIVSIHANMEADDETKKVVVRGLRKSMIEGILRVVDRFPQLEPAPSVVLASVCTAPPLNASEWAPLLGSGGLLSETSHVRLACLESMMMMVLDGQRLDENPLVESRLWLSKFDADPENAELASEVWNARGSPISPRFGAPLLVLLSDRKSHVRDSTARALAGGMAAHSEAGVALLKRLYSLHDSSAPPPPPKLNDAKLDMDKFFAAPIGAKPTTSRQEDAGWPSRAGVASCLRAIGEARAFDGADTVNDVFSFLVEHGLADIDTRVRGQMLAAGLAIITAYGDDDVLRFLRPCEAVMSNKARKDEVARYSDWRREGAVVLMGCTAKHLDKEDPKVVSIVQTLVGALATPSEAVQIAVSDCLAPLMKTPVVKEQGPDILKNLLARCVKGNAYGDRRGAAFGVAAVVKGLGIASIKKHQVISTLEAACKGTSSPGKQGALCAFECMCVRLGLLFEPYVIVILPHLLKCFGDSSNHVREAAHECARAIMSKLSAHGVKLILPAILKSLSDDAWRTKQGAIELLGSMAHCAPRQLADSLPMIVPKLTDAFADTHPKVRDSGRKALEDIGSVIRNPEVASLSMTLMSALSDPSKHTRGALEALLACEFMHSIDAPSLALLVPVLQRGLKDRSADVKRKAALITGNTCSMISEPKDLLPYLAAILPGLKATCIDPIPDVRATAAKALAALVRGMGEEKVGDVVPWLVDTLKADSSSSERSGGAQALSEVLVVLGMVRACTVLGDLLSLAAHPKGSVREGVLWVLCFLPGALGKEFAPIIPQALPVILAGLSDEVEAVREVSLRAGQVLVSTHGKSHADQVLPALEEGLFDDNWRIRQSSVQLLGDLLYLIGDTREVALDEGTTEDDARGSTRAGQAIEAALGMKRRNGILASLYLIRSDTSAVVRQSALQVWKTVVPNTPKALREILSNLIGQIVSALASDHPDKRTVAGRALGDIVKKLGDQVLPEVVPFLRDGLEAGDENMRQGVCLGLAEIMDCATSRQVEEFIDTLVPAIQDALCDRSPEVREQSAQAFHSLYKAVGLRSIEHVVPSLLKELGQNGDSEIASSARERAVYGLKEVVQLRPRDLLPYLIPKLVAVPISSAHAWALGAVAEVTGGSIHSHLAAIIPAVVAELALTDSSASSENELGSVQRVDALKHGASTLVSSIETVGVAWLCNEMARQMSSKDPRKRKWSVWLMEQFLRGTQADFSERIPQIVKELLQRLVDGEKPVLLATWSALKVLNARVLPEHLVEHLTFARSIIASIVSDARHRKGGGGAGADFHLPGVNIPKGLEPLLPMYQHGLMNGSAEVRETAASGIGELVEVTATKFLQPFLIKIIGPLIRIVGDRFPPGVKAAILHTLGLLLSKGGSSLRSFVPQLQTTFVKALGDASRTVRKEGQTALGQLMGLTTRVDPLVSDLASGIYSAGDPEVRRAMLEALAEVLELAGSKASQTVVKQVIQGLEALQNDVDGGVRTAMIRVLDCAQELIRT